jgi:predicted branched-subunit amino acid permease
MERIKRMWHRIARGLRATLPIALGVAPFGIAYGAVAAQGLTLWQGMLMSATVFAGTAQFIAASMIAQGAAFVPILVTGLLINARLVLLSASLAPYLSNTSRPLQWLIAQLLTDESFAVTAAEYSRAAEYGTAAEYSRAAEYGTATEHDTAAEYSRAAEYGRATDTGHAADPLYAVGSGLAIYIVWQIATYVGLTFGARIPDGLGLEYALPASLVCLLFLLVRTRHAALVAAGAGILSLVLLPLVSGTWTVMVATLLAATLGVACKRPH